MRLRFLDISILVLGAAVVIASAALVYGRHSGEASVLISGEGGEWVYPLKDDRNVNVPGPLGETTVEIAGGKVHIEDSPCPNKTCVTAGWISQPGQWLACLPNAVMVRIGGGDSAQGGVDAGVY